MIQLRTFWLVYANKMVATFMSIPQLFWLKKDSLPESTVLRQNALHTLAHLNTSSTNSTEDDMKALDCLEEIRFLKKCFRN